MTKNTKIQNTRNLDGKRILVTGGAGFIGSALIRYIMKYTETSIVNVDKLTYAGNLDSLEDVPNNSRYSFEKADICNTENIDRILKQYKPNAIINLAAESHVDRSIDGPAEFVQTNIVGTYSLLDSAFRYYKNLCVSDKNNFIFHHVSTDEVYGSLGTSGSFNEQSPYKPNSPYSASKAAADHMVRAWYETYGLPIIITNCSNNFGPYQFPEKFIPTVILNAISGKTIPVYGDGSNVRDWIYVDDHVRALWKVINIGKPYVTYNVGAESEKTNIDIANTICLILDEMLPESEYCPHSDLIKFVDDRPGHDRRYAIDSGKIKNETGWHPNETFENALRKTIQWYLSNKAWRERILNGSYRGERLGLSHV